MKNGRDSGFNYWKLNYRKKFIRTLWMIPFGGLAVVLMVITDIQIKTLITLSVLIVITVIAQLIYTYIKWKNTSSTE